MPKSTAALRKTAPPISRAEEMVKKREEFEKNMERWMEIEELTIGSCDAIMKKSKSPVVTALMKAIRMDSEKHKELLKVVLDCLEGTVTFTPEDLETVSSLLSEHIKFEKEAIDMAERSIADSRHFVISHILKYILEDERKHFAMMADLNTFKRHIYPYA